MNFETWEPIYEQIVRDFEFDPEADRRARDRLSGMVKPFDMGRLDFIEKSVAIAGGSETLRNEFDLVERADRVIAVSNAAKTMTAANIRPDLVVTDLDKTPDTAIELSYAGVPVAVHGHGDNLSLLSRYVPQFNLKNVIGTTQVEPLSNVVNFGGFTDGDRAAFFADHLEAGELLFPGWAFDDTTVSSEKARKLWWAARLLQYLERQRGEEFTILDGHREEIEDGSFDTV